MNRIGSPKVPAPGAVYGCYTVLEQGPRRGHSRSYFCRCACGEAGAPTTAELLALPTRCGAVGCVSRAHERRRLAGIWAAARSA